MVMVETRYSAGRWRKPNISVYKTKKEAEEIIKATLKWGIGILSCKIIKKKKEVKEIEI